ncbi:hypothetical protein Ancab_037742 [Ancistrocladus abbreviatus]
MLQEGVQKEGNSECEILLTRFLGFEPARGGYDYNTSPPSFSISVVLDSFDQDTAGDQLPAPVLPSQASVHNSKCNAEKQVIIAATSKEERDNDEIELEKVGIVELSQEVMGMINGGGKLKKHNVVRGKRVQGRGVYSEECTNPILHGPKEYSLWDLRVKPRNRCLVLQRILIGQETAVWGWKSQMTFKGQ